VGLHAALRRIEFAVRSSGARRGALHLSQLYQTSRFGAISPRTTPRNGTSFPAFVVVKVYVTSALNPGLKITCVHSSALQPADDEVVVASDALTCLMLRPPARRPTGPDLSSQGLARLVPTLTDGTHQSSPPDSDLRHFESAPYAVTTYHLGVVSVRLSRPTLSAWGGIARCRKSANQLPGGFQQIGDVVR
jgi:hypothetical protein